MFRNRILLVSLLKPVTDTRMYEKLGRSLLKLPQVEIHIAGYRASSPSSLNPRIHLHPIFKFKRLSISRFTAQWKYWQLLKQVRPQLIIVGTHELLLVSWIYSHFTDCKLVYDIRENYALNLSTQNIYKHGLGGIMSYVVSIIERLTAQRVQHFFLAEEAYARELSFLHNNYSVLPNKYLPPEQNHLSSRSFPVKLSPNEPLRLLFSGTISRLYGTLEAVRFTQELRRYIEQIELTIIGYCADHAFLEELKSMIQPLPYVTLIGGDHLVPHSKILELERHSHIGLLPYLPHPSTFTCIPTKLYEYMANGLIVLIQKNPPWDEIIRKAKAGIPYDFTGPFSTELKEKLLQHSFYTTGAPNGIYWLEEEPAFLNVINKLISK